jgi:hypothetical protein
MKKWLRRILVSLLLLVVVLAASALIFRKELLTLGSLKQVDEHPLYRMTYHGDYGFSDFLQVGARNDREIERFVVKKLLKGIDIHLNIASAGCSAFCAWNEKGQRIFARNFDFDPAPALLLEADPSDGYASVSISNLAFAGYGSDYLPEPFTFSSFLTLAAPYLPFDGMNEKGVAMALLAVPHAEPLVSQEMVMLNTTTMIRLVLDRSKSVEEALALIKEYTLYFSGGVECHYLVSDASGDSAIVEFLDNDIKITKIEGNYQAVTNFIVFGGRNEGEGGSEFERYDTIVSRLNAADGVITETEAMSLLADVKIPGRTQWSAVYNLATGTVQICMGGKFDKVCSYTPEILQ